MSPPPARTVQRAATGHEVSDGPFIEAKEWLIGFYVIDRRDELEALARAKQICADPHHVIELRPVNRRWQR
jgi:hypothetical protein